MFWLIAIIILLVFILLVPYICAQMCFAVKSSGRDEPQFPKGKQYLELKDEILALIDEASAIPYEDVYVKSFDGLRLHAKFYAVDPNAPTHIMFHGYRSSALLDFGGGLRDAVKRGENALLVDQRAHAASEGKYLSFGINESRDCLTWIDYVNQHQGTDKPVILQGLSMGAATVMMASALELPDNVRGILADCGYSSPEKIIRYVMGKTHYPQWMFPLLRLGGRIYAGFDICANSPVKALESCQLPVFFIHGKDDRFVPYEMGLENYNACPTKKWLFSVDDAGHGLCYLKSEAAYKVMFKEFISEALK